MAGRVELGLGVTPKVSPRCTGAVDALTVLFCAGIAWSSAALGCGASVITGALAGITGMFTLASIWTGFGSGFGFGISICLGCNSTFGISGGGGTCGGGGSGLMCTGGGGVAGMTSSVCS